ncbi:unnamed protein product [Paramecium sonneborni]|uniref:Uncharacterized protein n=1 Tax=Paramecium sonneborni TaxID=65129 RepID=A0A8S1KIL3_9CILI|nr:unnamed protein product [Paramecium sonneborni]
MSFRIEDSPQFKGEDLSLSKIYQYRESQFSRFSFPSSVRHQKKFNIQASVETKTPTPNQTNIENAPTELSYEIERMVKEREHLFTEVQYFNPKITFNVQESPQRIRISRNSAPITNTRLYQLDQQIIDAEHTYNQFSYQLI